MSAFGVPTQTHSISHRLSDSVRIAAIPQTTTGGAFRDQVSKGHFCCSFEIGANERSIHALLFMLHIYIKFSLLDDVILRD